MFKIGPKARLGLRSSTPEASPDDPIYQRGFVIGETHSTNSSKNTAEKASPQSSSNQKEASSSNPDLTPKQNESSEN